MATYTSTQIGNWNDPATWGGGGFPQLTGDVFNIGHLVTLNVQFDPATVQFGQGNLNNNGILAFARDMNTRLPFGHQDLVINSGGWLKVGESGLIIPKQYTAEMVWNTTSDNAKGINLAAGGKFTVYGDPTFYGSKYDYILATQVVIPAATNTVTITVVGNYAANFTAGQELLIHKGGAYASYINDFARLAVVSAANNGANTDIACTVTERPAALACLVGADVLNVSRNVVLYKLSYNANLGQYNTNRPRMANSNAAGSTNINISDAVMAGWTNAVNSPIGGFYNSVIRNSGTAMNQVYAVNDISGIMFSCNIGVNIPINCSISAYIVGCSNPSEGGSNVNLSGNIYGNANGLFNYGGSGLILSGASYSNSDGIRSGIKCTVTGSISYDKLGNAKSNSNDINFGDSNISGAAKIIINLNNAKVHATIGINGRNNIKINGRFLFEHYQQIANSHYVIDNMGDIAKVNTGATGSPPSGAANYLKVLNPQSNLGTGSWLDIISYQQFRVWQKAGTVTYKVYVQAPTANNYDYGASDLVLYAEYISAASPLTVATMNSTGGSGLVRANDWTKYLTVTVTSAADGWVTLYLRLMKYYAAGDVIYVDPGIWAGGNLLMGDWSLGELIYPGPSSFGGGNNPSLLPLGVMEVVN